MIAVSGERRDSTVPAQVCRGCAGVSGGTRRPDIRRPGTVHHTAVCHSGQSLPYYYYYYYYYYYMNLITLRKSFRKKTNRRSKTNRSPPRTQRHVTALVWNTAWKRRGSLLVVEICISYHACGLARVFSDVCYFQRLSVCLCALKKKKNGFSYHQSWYGYSPRQPLAVLRRWSSKGQRSRSQGYEVRWQRGSTCQYDCFGFPVTLSSVVRKT